MKQFLNAAHFNRKKERKERRKGHWEIDQFRFLHCNCLHRDNWLRPTNIFNF